MVFTAKHTRYGCYLGTITQAIVNNLPPLLFLTFHKQFGISLEKISLLIMVNFCIQIIVDLLSPAIIQRIGYRRTTMLAFISTAIGLAGLGTLPFLLEDAFVGLLLATGINAIGGGIIEVTVSPLVEALPGDEKESAMSMLHSFYCWGHMGVVILSTLYFKIIGITQWQYLPLLWAVIPLFNIFLFSQMPMYVVPGDEEKRPLRELFGKKVFWALFILMICAGASEQAISQWSSLFAEAGLGVNKTLGDLLGPCSFALCMGISRLLYGIWGNRIRIYQALRLSALLCVVSYLVTVFIPVPIISLIGCAISGFAVGLMWPGVFSLAGKLCYGGGTFMYAMLALAGDVGCSAGPAVVGVVSEIVQESRPHLTEMIIQGRDFVEIGLKSGILVAVVFPVLMFGVVAKMVRYKRS